MATEHPDRPGPEPRVTVVIPVYNVVDYLPATLDSTLRQGLAPQELEVIAVDDGSTDGSGEVLDDYARRHPQIRVIHQENSGGPGQPRNRAIAEARGRYLFFLDSDDEFTDGALRNLADTADRTGAEVVLAKPRGTGGRRAPRSSFEVSTEDADIVEHKLFNTLAPWKLFARDLILRSGARFETDLKIGEDQPFVARAYFQARRIAVCADRDYYLLHGRDDGSNISKSGQSALDVARQVRALLRVIAADTEPGPLRRAVLRRPLKGKLPMALDRRFLAADEEERREVVAIIAREVPPLYTPEVADLLSGTDRLAMDLAVQGRTEDVTTVVRWAVGREGRLVTHDGSRFRLRIPDQVAAVLDGIEDVAEVRPEVRLDAVRVHEDEVLLEGTAWVCDADTPAGALLLRLRNRSTDTVLDLPVPDLRTTDLAEGVGVRFRAEIPTADLALGVWDLHVVQVFGDQELERRLGGRRGDDLEARPRYLLDGGEPVGVVYFTKGHGNLSLDLGFSVHPNRLPQGTLVALLPHPAGLRAVIEHSARTAPEVRIGSTRAKLARTPVASQALSRSVVGAVLDLSAARPGDEVWLRLAADQVEHTVGTAPDLAIPEHVGLRPLGDGRFEVLNSWGESPEERPVAPRTRRWGRRRG